jgi:glycine cleavage system H lipoate-binding protein
MNLDYDVERDVWARLEDDGQVTLGLTDVGLTFAAAAPTSSRC